MMNHRRGSIQSFGETSCQQLFARLLTKGEPFCFRLIVLDEVQRVSAHVAMLHLGKILLTSPMDGVLTLHHRLTVRFALPLYSVLKLAGVCAAKARVGNGRFSVTVNKPISKLN